MRVLAPEQIAARLDDRFGLLTGGSRTAPRREQTLHASIDRSYQLLSDAERALLRRLTVFAGGWTLEAAEAIGADESNAASGVLNLLSALVDKSLVVAESQGEHARYRLLETIRQYAGQKLRDAGEATLARTRHLAWYEALAERAAPELWQMDAATWLGRLATEYDNLRAALERCRQSDPPSGLRLTASLRSFWIRRGRFAEGSRWLTTMLDLAPMSAPARAAALLGAGILARDQGRMAPATL